MDTRSNCTRKQNHDISGRVYRLTAGRLSVRRQTLVEIDGPQSPRCVPGFCGSYPVDLLRDRARGRTRAGVISCELRKTASTPSSIKSSMQRASYQVGVGQGWRQRRMKRRGADGTAPSAFPRFLFPRWPGWGASRCRNYHVYPVGTNMGWLLASTSRRCPRQPP